MTEHKVQQLVSTGYTYVWEFLVQPGMEDEFLRYYGPDGKWTELFRQGPGYRETMLLRDSSMPGRYLTLDRWESEEAYRLFLDRFGREYVALDRRCEGLTGRETSLGSFTEVS